MRAHKSSEQEEQPGLGASQFSPPAPRGQTPIKPLTDMLLEHEEASRLGVVSSGLDMSLPQNINSKTLEFLSGGGNGNSSRHGKHGKGHRMSLVDFSKKISEEDQFSLNRKHLPPGGPGHLEGDLKTAEKEVTISDELARSIRMEITDEYWNILEMMESAGKKGGKSGMGGEEESSLASTTTASESFTASASNVGAGGALESQQSQQSQAEDLMFFDEDDLEEFPVLHRKLNRTARMYNRVKARTLLKDTDSSLWPEVIEEELELELAEAIKAEEALNANPNMRDARRRDEVFEINKRKGIIKRTLKKEAKKDLSTSVHFAIDPYSGENKQLERENLLPDYTGEGLEKCSEEQWRTSDAFKQASVSMSANDPTNQAAPLVSAASSASLFARQHSRNEQEKQASVQKARQRAAATKRRKAVMKVVLMDPFAAAGCKVDKRMHHNAQDDVVKPVDEDDSDRFALLQPGQLQWRKDMSQINYELSAHEEPRETAATVEEVRQMREQARLEQQARAREEALAREEEAREEAEERARLRHLEESMAAEIDSVEGLDDLLSREGEQDGSDGSDDKDDDKDDDDKDDDDKDEEGEGEKEKEVTIDFDTLFSNGLIDEDEYDRLKIIRAEEEHRRKEEAEEEERRKEVSKPACPACPACLPCLLALCVRVCVCVRMFASLCV